MDSVKRDDVFCLLRTHRDRLQTSYGVKSLMLFGSIARDEGRDDSDVDLLVEFDRPTGYFTLFRLQDDLAALLNTPVDLGTFASLKERFRATVMAEAIHVS